MKSVIEVDIEAPQARVVALFTDPSRNTAWMEDVDRVEPVAGELGALGSKYRLMPKKGDMVFTATVLARNLPYEANLSLEASHVTVQVTGRFVPTGPGTTRLISEEVFRFNGVGAKLLGLLAQGAIRKAHRRHIEAFKRFAEAQR
ncbi:MAG TPA: SRPBCC family protein [Gemmatimonadales bacterium]|nr:SRPBCC family protein [Gemmatimonadales bacterium]